MTGTCTNKIPTSVETSACKAKHYRHRAGRDAASANRMRWAMAPRRRPPPTQIRRGTSKGPAMTEQRNAKPRLRSRLWFDNPDNPGMTALYLERYLNYGLTRRELTSGR